DQMDALPQRLAPGAVAGGDGGAVQYADLERRLAEQRVQERRLADADATEHGNVDVPVLQLVQHHLDATVVGREAGADAAGDGGIVEQCAQAVGGAQQVRVTATRRRIATARPAQAPPAITPPHAHASPSKPSRAATSRAAT